MRPKVSVTIPVYNTSKYLKKCLDSLSNQTLEDIEFIIVNDGSTDESAKICKEYVDKDSRFKYFYQENGGLASARQTGLNKSSGDYIIVCDSDDWVEPEIYQRLYYKAVETEADIVTCCYISEYGDGNSILNKKLYKEKDGIVDNLDLLLNGAGSSWVKLIRRSLFDISNTNYVPGVNLSEDSLILYKLFRLNPKVIQLPDCLYHYRREFRGQSYTNSIKMHHIYQLRFTYDWLKANYTTEGNRILIYNRALDLVFACLRVDDLDTDYLMEFVSNELPWRTIGNNRISLKVLIASSIKLFPTCMIKYIIKKLYPFFYK